MVHYKTELMLEFPGFVLFDPVVLQEFVLEKGIEDDDLLKYFINNPTIGEESIQRGILLPIYNIEPFDYEILINTTTKSEIPTDWVVFKNEVSLPLQVKSGRLAVEDIFMIMNWDYESNYSDFATEKSLNPQPNVEGGELNGDTGDRFDIPAGNYGVKVLGFLDVNEPDIFESKSGYELLKGFSSFIYYFYFIIQLIYIYIFRNYRQSIHLFKKQFIATLTLKNIRFIYI